ncbi:spore germination protein [Paenibacillus sp. NEAU-GSW1]|uniref:spore germination protein n=1 Tax=Paenibacillus sp. NEAU-GSW1 TaxID=2682486 RepID=UPI0012E12A7E|nr:spore germination protein [Paenibacillus sp. NEAU-GSW1]MUT64384.1 spore germination protein [Paenibacillus sp. NEAU-GSW1]
MIKSSGNPRVNNGDAKESADQKPFRMTQRSIEQFFSYCDDVIVDGHQLGSPPISVVIAYNCGMAETRMINEVILPELARVYEKTKFLRKEDVDNETTLVWVQMDLESGQFGAEAMAVRVFEGHMLFCLPSLKTMWSIDISNIPTRAPEQSKTEVTIRGSGDGFIEPLAVNVALIRTRLRTSELACKFEVIGTLSANKVALMYMRNIANEEMIKHIHEKLQSIKVERLLTSNQLEEMLSPLQFTLFPVTHYTGRPDFAAECLVNGRFVIIVDGNPSAIIGPVNLFLLLKSPEDANFPFFSVNIGRMLRFLGLAVTLFLPGFYIALTTFHTDQIPFSLITTISTGRMGLPMETSLEMFLIMVLMELFREAGVRLPMAIGQTLTVVGGLIIGESAIRAGIVSPLMIVVIAITIVAGATIVNQVMSSSIIMIRFVSFFLGATLGIYGFILSVILFLIYLTGLESFGVPYLTPISPLDLKQALAALFKLPRSWNKRRPVYLETQEPRKDAGK